jgi:glycosyltransferase involved in cell wall biosynthesis
MKVIHLVLGKANPDRMNGVNKVAHHLAMSQHELGVDVEIWGITKSPDATVYPRPFPTILFRAQPFYRDLEPKLLHAISKQKKGTVFHVHGAFITDFYKVTRLLNDLKIPYIYTPHGAFNKVALEKNKWVKKVYINRYEKSILKDARKVQFLGQSEFDHISTIVRLQNKVVVPNGQDFGELEFEFHAMQRRAEPVFGFCGRLDIYYKGLDTLLDGFASYCQKGGEGELWLIGDGPDRPKLEAQCKSLKITDRVQFMGARYGKDKLNRIANMDLFCHPSRSEGSPTAVLEAGALGRPLMVSTATNVGVQVEQHQCGLHLRQSNAKSIEKALFTFLKMYKEKEHPLLGERAREMVSNEFNWKAISKRLIEIYSAKG